jgi:SAM-dependent methyltransferase
MPVRTDLRRSAELFQAGRHERADPDRFYRLLAADSVRQVLRHHPLDGSLVLDVGGGVGYVTDAFRDAGARCVLIEPELGGLGTEVGGLVETTDDGAVQRMGPAPARKASAGSIVGDGYQLPFTDGIADITFSSNVLEHVRDQTAFITEMIRVTKPGGIVYVSFTNWYSPWGGHATAPWHYFGGEWALKRYIRTTGRVPVNRFGESLFAVHVGATLRWAENNSAVDVLRAQPRYYPDWCDWIVRIPGLREVVTWNLLLILRRRA